MPRELVLPRTATIQKRYTYTIENFYGVDYSSSRLHTMSYRSTSARNYVRRKNVLQKRYGLKQVGYLNNNLIIHNVWSFDDQLHNRHYIVNASGTLYELNQNTFELTLIENNNGENKVLDREVSAFPTNNRLYILGGVKYLICYFDEETSKLKIESIAGSSFAYVPTTTIGITPLDSAVGGNRQTLDSANLLTYWRKNKFISGTHYDKDTQETIINSLQEFQLDSEITYKNVEELSKMVLDIDFYGNETEQFEIDANSSMREAHLNVVFCKGINLNGLDENHTTDELIQDNKIGGIYILVNYAVGDFNSSYLETIKDSIITCNSSTGEEQGFRVYGYINLSGSVVLFNDYNNPNSENNITFTFPCYDEETYLTNYIDTCFIGKVYNSNNINSLFVAGNPSYPARDWHSETINASALNDKEAKLLTIKDLVYFPDDSYCDYGEDNANPILGYDVLGTGDLLVLKKYQTYEPTIYFRTGQLVAVQNDYGETLSDLIGATLYKPEYSLTVGNIGVSLNNYMKIVNYNGDTIFIGNDKKINGLDKETKSYDNQRYAFTRSILIDSYLHDIDLNNSFLFEDSDCLYFVNNNEIFVNKYGEDAVENLMEWYHLEYKYNFVSMFKIEGKIYLCAEDGRLFLFRNKNVFYDEVYEKYGEGEILTTQNSSNITLSHLNTIQVGDTIKFDIRVKCKIGKINEDYSIDLVNKTFTILNSNLIGYFVSTNYLSYNNRELIITRVDAYNYDIVSKIEGNIEETDAYLLLDTFVISEIDSENNIIKVNGDIFGANETPTGKIYHYENVVAYYFTAPILFNDTSMSYFKNVWSFTFANDVNEQNETSIDLVDNSIGFKDGSYIVSAKDNYGYNLANLDFGLINLEQNKVPVKTQTIYRKILKKPYVVLKFFNENNTNSVLSRISFVYSYGSNMR